MEENGSNLGGRAYLVSKLRERGISRRQAVEVVNAILDAMIMALRRGKDVEFPFGRLSRVKRQFGARWDHDDDWPAHRDRYTVKWIPNWEDLKQLLGPEAAEEEVAAYAFDPTFIKAYLMEQKARRRKRKAGK